MATITNALAIGYNNLASGKTITVTNAQAGFPASNLNTPRLYQRHKGNAGSLTSFNYDADLASNQLFECIGLLGVNYSDGATRTIKADDTAGFGSPTLDVGSASVFDVSEPPLVSDIPPHGRHLLHVFNTPAASRYTRVTVSDAGNADNALRASVYWVSKLWQPAASFGFDWVQSDVIDGEPGLERAYRQHKFTLGNLTRPERNAIRGLARAMKRSGRVLIIPNPLTAATWVSEVIYATFLDMLEVSPLMTTSSRWSTVLTFREVDD